MTLHFPLPKIRTFRFSIHTSRLSLHGEVTMVALKFAIVHTFHCQNFFLQSHFPSLPSRRGHHGGAEIRNSSHFPLPKNFSPSGFVPPLSNGTSRTTSDRKPKTNFAQSYFVLPIEKLNQINTKNYWK